MFESGVAWRPQGAPGQRAARGRLQSDFVLAQFFGVVGLAGPWSTSSTSTASSSSSDAAVALFAGRPWRVSPGRRCGSVRPPVEGISGSPQVCFVRPPVEGVSGSPFALLKAARGVCLRVATGVIW